MEQESIQRDKTDTGFFVALERYEQELSAPVNIGLRRDAWWIALAVLGMLLVFAPFTAMFGRSTQVWLTLVGLVLQLLGFVVVGFRQTRDIVPDFIDAKRKYAAELDEHFAARERVLAWLRTFPRTARIQRLKYVEARLESMRARYALIFGAVEKLGLLPILVGVFVQIQAWKSASQLTMIFGVFIAALYFMSLWMAGYRLQLESYARLIRAAQEDGE